MGNIQKYIFKHSDTLNKKPTVSQLELGEIAVNYAKGSEKLFIKNTNNEIVELLGQNDDTTLIPSIYESNRKSYYIANNISDKSQLPSDAFDGIQEDVSPSVNSTNKYLWKKTIIQYEGKEDLIIIELVGVYGDKGLDGTDINYIYTTTSTNSAPNKPNNYGNWEEHNYGNSFTSSDGKVWSDEPQDMNDTDKKYQWVSVSYKRNGIWDSFSTPTLWSVYSVDGKDGVNGQDGVNGVSSFVSTIYIYSKTTPDTPDGGSYDNPQPTNTNWSDGIPTTNSSKGALWMSQRTFYSDNRASVWSTPKIIKDTEEVDFCFSATYDPINNNVKPSTTDGINYSGNVWHNESSINDIYMAVGTVKNGTYGNYNITKIKGERGADATAAFSFTSSTDTLVVSKNGGEKTLYVTLNALEGTDNVTNKCNFTVIGSTDTGCSATIITDNGSKKAKIVVNPITMGTVDSAQITLKCSYTNTNSITFDSERNINVLILKEGAAGISYDGTDEYYLWSNNNTGITTSTNGWTKSTSIPTNINNYKHLWNYEVVKKSDGTSSTIEPHIMYSMPEKGEKGEKGADGINGMSITNINQYYIITETDSRPTSENSNWITDSTLSPTSEKPYLWNKEVITLSNGTITETQTNIRFITKFVRREISKVYTYIITHDENKPSENDTNWSTDVQPLTSHEDRLWKKTTITYDLADKNGNLNENVIDLVGRMGQPGVDGKDGKRGIGSTWLYARTNTISEIPNVPTVIDYTDGSDEDIIYVNTTDNNWTDEPQGVDKDNKYEWTIVSYYKKGKWGNFSNPILWNQYMESGSFTSTVYIYSKTTPDTPDGGSYDNPQPTNTNWSDGIPATNSSNGALWMSQRTFHDPKLNIETTWSTPIKVQDTKNIDFCFSSTYNPSTNIQPKTTDGLIYTDGVWHDKSVDGDIYMATGIVSNGDYSSAIYQITKIKGEDGRNGVDGRNGQDGTILSDIKVYFLTNNSNVTPNSDDSNWQLSSNGASPNTTSEKPYLWKKTIYTYTGTNSQTKESIEFVGKIGDKGLDGPGQNYIFTRTKTDTQPNTPKYKQGDSQNGVYIKGDWDDGTKNSFIDENGVVWFDEPQGVTDEFPFEWSCCSKKLTSGVWETYYTENSKLATLYSQKPIANENIMLESIFGNNVIYKTDENSKIWYKLKKDENGELLDEIFLNSGEPNLFENFSRYHSHNSILKYWDILNSDDLDSSDSDETIIIDYDETIISKRELNKYIKFHDNEIDIFTTHKNSCYFVIPLHQSLRYYFYPKTTGEYFLTFKIESYNNINIDDDMFYASLEYKKLYYSYSDFSYSDFEINRIGNYLYCICKFKIENINSKQSNTLKINIGLTKPISKHHGIKIKDIAISQNAPLYDWKYNKLDNQKNDDNDKLPYICSLNIDSNNYEIYSEDTDFTYSKDINLAKLIEISKSSCIKYIFSGSGFRSVINENNKTYSIETRNILTENGENIDNYVTIYEESLSRHNLYCEISIFDNILDFHYKRYDGEKLVDIKTAQDKKIEDLQNDYTNLKNDFEKLKNDFEDFIQIINGSDIY